MRLRLQIEAECDGDTIAQLREMIDKGAAVSVIAHAFEDDEFWLTGVIVGAVPADERLAEAVAHAGRDSCDRRCRISPS